MTLWSAFDPAPEPAAVHFQVSFAFEFRGGRGKTTHRQPFVANRLALRGVFQKRMPRDPQGLEDNPRGGDAIS